MVCLHCGHKTKVTNSRSSRRHFTTWRRRECMSCGSIYTSREYVDLASSLRVQGAATALEPFQRDKLFMSLIDSLTHRKTALTDATELTSTIIDQLLALHSGGVLQKTVIRDMTVAVLGRFDEVSAVHYRAHHS